MKLNDFERQDYRSLKAQHKGEGGKFMYGEYKGRRFTVAAVRRAGHVHLGFALCGPNDVYNKRRGKYVALCKLHSYNALVLPIGFPFQFGWMIDADIISALGIAGYFTGD